MPESSVVTNHWPNPGHQRCTLVRRLGNQVCPGLVAWLPRDFLIVGAVPAQINEKNTMPELEFYIIF